MTKSQKRKLRKLIISAIVFVFALCLDVFATETAVWPEYLSLALLIAAYLFIGGKVLKNAITGIWNGQLFDENFLMAVATVGALVIGEYHEAVAVMLFYQLGEWFEHYAVGKSRASITELMNIRPDTATIERNGTFETVGPEEVNIDDVIVIRAGERIPLDGIVIEGCSSLDTSSLTGESLPRTINPDDEVISGCINLTGKIRVRVSKQYEDSTVARILELVENASDKKAKVESFISRFARIYTPAVCALALLLFLIPPLFFAQKWSEWGYRALSFLVVSCPCALVISVPLSFFGGIGGASRCGILVKGSNYLEALSRAKIAVFDKTGTLTEGQFSVVDVQPACVSTEELLQIACVAESHSNHPISKSICRYAGINQPVDGASYSVEYAGMGISVEWQNSIILVGNAKLMLDHSISIPSSSEERTSVYVARDGVYLGCITLADEPKAGSIETISQLRKNGIRKTVMLTGDSKQTSARIAAKLGIDEVHSQLLPADKITHVEKLLSQKADGDVLLFVGDGINDAPVLMRADVGIAMGALGSDAAVEASDIVLMDDDPRKLCTALRISRKTMAIVKQNIVFALGVKLMVLALVALGMSGMWLAVFADVGVSVLAIINAMRALHIR